MSHGQGLPVPGFDKIFQTDEIMRPPDAAVAQKVGRLRTAPVTKDEVGSAILGEELERQLGANPFVAGQMRDAAPADQAVALQRQNFHVAAAVRAKAKLRYGSDFRLGMNILGSPSRQALLLLNAANARSAGCLDVRQMQNVRHDCPRSSSVVGCCRSVRRLLTVFLQPSHSR
jgi:hypothetical protein